MLLLALIALGAAAPPAPDWRPFDWRQRGVVAGPAHYDGARIERRGQRIKVWLRTRIFLSGLPDLEDETRVEIDCASRSSRVVEAMITADAVARYGWRLGRPGRRAIRADLVPIPTGSTHEALAQILCARK